MNPIRQRDPRGRSLRQRRTGVLPALGLLLLSGASIAQIATTVESLHYDLGGNVDVRSTDLETTTYGYDALNRLKQEQGPRGYLTYGLDANGNRLNDSQGSYSYSTGSNQLTTRRGATVTTDSAGNITADGTGLTFTYNQAGRLKQAFKNGTLVATYTYNALGLRTTKVTPSGTTVYHYDLQGHLIQETTAAAVAQTTYVWRDDTPLAIFYAPNTPSNTTAQEKVVYLHTDHLSTPRRASDAAAKTVWRWDSDAFGSTAPNQDPNHTGVQTVVNFRFPGQYYDSETGLYYNTNRYLIPSLGRYLTSDPMGLKGGLNPFGYANLNPLRYTDRLGLCVEDACIAEGAALMAAMEALGNLSGAAAIQQAVDQLSGLVFAKPKPGSKPKNCPSGTIPIDQAGLDKDQVHGIKDGVGAGPTDWTGIAPNGDVITGDHEGNAVNNGNKNVYLP